MVRAATLRYVDRSMYLSTRVPRMSILSFHSDLRDPVFVLNHSQLFLTDDILHGEFLNYDREIDIFFYSHLNSV